MAKSSSTSLSAPTLHGEKMFAAKLRSSERFTLLVVCVTGFTDILLYGLIVPVLPFALSSRLNLGEDEVQRWTSILLAEYGAAMGVGAILFGWISDISHSRRAPFIFGLLLEAGSTLLFAFGRSITVLQVARLLQGLSASVCGSIGTALLVDRFGTDRIGETSGWSTISLTSGFFMGPVIGGVLYQFAGYTAVFIPVFVLIAVEVVMRCSLIDCRTGNPQRAALVKNDFLEEGYATMTQRAGSNTTVSTEEDSAPSKAHGTCQTSHPLTWRQKFPIVRLLSSRTIVATLLLTIILNSFAGAFESVLTLHSHELFGLTPSLAGLMFVPVCIASFFAPLIGRFMDRSGPHKLGKLAFYSLAALFLLMSWTDHDDWLFLTLLVVLLIFYGLAYQVACTFTSITLTKAIEHINKSEPTAFGPGGSLALLCGMHLCTFGLGAVVGTIYGGFIRESVGWPAMTITMAFLSLLGIWVVHCTADKNIETPSSS